MTNYSYTVSLAGIPLRLECRFPRPTLVPFQTDEAPVETIAATGDASVPLRYALSPENANAQNAEYIRMVGMTGSALLRRGRCLLHGMAFVWRGRAWIFTGPSGVGKTTQYALWKERYEDEVTILNGDKPILAFDGGIRVHPSPWQGKENMGNLITAPLGGIVCLTQGSENQVHRLSASEAVPRLFRQFLFVFDELQTVDRVCAMETELIRSVPVWELTNRGDGDSARLMHETLAAWEEL